MAIYTSYIWVDSLMPSYYRIANYALAKQAHHEAMAEVHGNLLSEHHQNKSEQDPRGGRSESFHEAAIAHHSRELSYNESQARDYKGGRSFSSVSQHNAPAHADTEMFGSRQPSRVYDDNGRLMARINQIRNPLAARDIKEQGHLQDFRDAGNSSVIDPDINKRFI